MQRRTVLLITSDHLGWNGVRTALQALSAVRVVGEATTDVQALGLAATLQPDVIVAGANVAGRPALPMLLYLRRDVCPRAVFIILRGYLEPTKYAEIAGAIMARLPCEHEDPAEYQYPCVSSTGANLTVRELAVLRGLAAGMPREKIGAAHGLSQRTVDRIVASLYAKLDAPTPVALGAKAAELGLLS